MIEYELSHSTSLQNRFRLPSPRCEYCCIASHTPNHWNSSFSPREIICDPFEGTSARFASAALSRIINSAEILRTVRSAYSQVSVLNCFPMSAPQGTPRCENKIPFKIIKPRAAEWIFKSERSTGERCSLTRVEGRTGEFRRKRQCGAHNLGHPSVKCIVCERFS